MGCHFSKLNYGGGGSIGKAVESERGPKKPIASYEEACRAVPELRSLDTLLTPKETVMIKNPKLVILAEEYFKNTVAAATLLASLKLRLSRARACHALILDAVQYHDEEAQKECLKKLKEFEEAARDAIADTRTIEDFDLVCERHRSMYREDGLVKSETEERLASTKRWREVWRAMHLVASVSTVTYSAAALATVSSPYVAFVAAATGACTVAKAAEWWMDSIWRQRLDALEAEKDVVGTIWRGGRFVVHELESVRAMAKWLETRIRSVSLDAEFALSREEDAEAVAMAVEEVKRKTGAVEECMEGMEMKVISCLDEIQKAVTQLLNIVKETQLDLSIIFIDPAAWSAVRDRSL